MYRSSHHRIKLRNSNIILLRRYQAQQPPPTVAPQLSRRCSYCDRFWRRENPSAPPMITEELDARISDEQSATVTGRKTGAVSLASVRQGRRELGIRATEASMMHGDVIRHCLPLHKLDILLAAQIPQDLPDAPPDSPVQHLATVLRENHDVILAVPLHVGLTLPLFHGRSSCPEGPSSRRTVPYSRRERQSLQESHRQRRWILFD